MAEKDILIIEDTPFQVVLLEWLCTQANCTYESAESLQDARNLLNRKRFDIILTDWEVWNKETTEQFIVENQRGNHIILVSGSDAAYRFAQKHGIRYLQKPFDNYELIEELKK